MQLAVLNIVFTCMLLLFAFDMEACLVEWAENILVSIPAAVIGSFTHLARVWVVALLRYLLVITAWFQNSEWFLSDINMPIVQTLGRFYDFFLKKGNLKIGWSRFFPDVFIASGIFITILSFSRTSIFSILIKESVCSLWAVTNATSVTVMLASWGVY